MKIHLILAQLLMCSTIVLSDTVTGYKQKVPPIAYKRQKGLFSWIYDDTHTGASDELSIHRPRNFQHGFYLLGDVAVGGYDQPVPRTAVMVKDLEGGALAPPKSFTWRWNDKGTHGWNDVTIYKMEPPEGYVCLGDVAVDNYKYYPDKSKYRCVKSEYVTKGSYEYVWQDTGGHGSYDCVIRNNRVSTSHPDGIDAGTFTSFDYYSTPSGAPYVLSAEYAEKVENLNMGNPDADITLYEMPEVTWVWDDSGTHASLALGVWRGHGPDDSYSLGDFADGQFPKSEYPKPGALLVAKARKSNVLAPPVEFSKIWEDSGSGATDDVIFYKPICPAGFIPLGHVAVASYSEAPSASLIRCVNASYTIPGKWKFIWNDLGSHSDDDISVYEAVAGEDGQGLGAMTAVDHYDGMTETAFVLDPQFVNYIIGKPAQEYRLSNVKYNLDAYSLGDSTIDNLLVVTAENRGDTTQTTTSDETFTYTEETSWNNHAGGEFGLEIKIEAGIPFIFEEEITVSGQVSYEHEWGGSTTTEKSDSISVKMEIKPCSSKVATVSGQRYAMDVPYTATLTTVYEDGTTGVLEDVEGVFYGVQVNQIHVVYEKDVPLDIEC